MFIRKVQVIVTPKDNPSKATMFQSHRIDFEVHSTVGWPADTATISIFNLSIDEVKFLQNKNYGDMYIEIRAGYVEESRVGARGGITSQTGDSNTVNVTGSYPTIFSGLLTNCIGYRRPPEHVTQMFCISKAYGASTDFKKMKSIPKGTTLKDAITSMCNDYGFNTISTFGVEDEVMNQVLSMGRVFHDTFLNEFKNLLGEYNLLYSMTTGEVQIFPDSYGDKDAVDRMSKDRAPIKLDANSVIGNPVAGICTYTLNTFLNPSIQTGMILDVSPLLGTELLANGVTSLQGGGIELNTDQSVFRWAMEDKYFIMDIVHSGSTHGMTFQTSITSVLGGNTAMGKKEAAWQQMYANSGMAGESF